MVPYTQHNRPLEAVVVPCAPGATPWPSEVSPPPATTATMGLRRQAGDDSPYRAREVPAVAEPRLRPAQVLGSMTPGVRPAVTLAFSARHDGGGGRAAKPAPPPPSPSPTPLPGAAPLATPPHGGPPGPGRRRRARPRTGTTAPPDGEDFAPHPAAMIIGHVADRCGSERKE
jgi:hypothetical protein